MNSFCLKSTIFEAKEQLKEIEFNSKLEELHSEIMKNIPVEGEMNKLACTFSTILTFEKGQTWKDVIKENEEWLKFPKNAQLVSVVIQNNNGSNLSNVNPNGKIPLICTNEMVYLFFSI